MSNLRKSLSNMQNSKIVKIEPSIAKIKVNSKIESRVLICYFDYFFGMNFTIMTILLIWGPVPIELTVLKCDFNKKVK